MTAARRALLLRGAVFAAWLALFTWLSAAHVGWRDEHQSWLVATRTRDLGELFHATRYERHPPLYYLWLRAASGAAAGLHAAGAPLDAHDPAIARAVTAPFTVGTAALLVFGFPAAPLWLCAVPFGLPFLMDYGVVVRCYGVGAFLLVLGAWLMTRGRLRPYWLCLVLAGGMHLYFTLIAGALFLLSLWDRRAQWRSLAAPAALVALAFVAWVGMQVPPRDSPFATGFDRTDWRAVLERPPWVLAFGLTGLDALSWREPFAWNRNGFTPLSGLFAVGVLAFAALRERFRVGRYLFAIAGVLPIMCFAYIGGTRHVATLFVALLALVLLDSPDRRPPRAFALFAALMLFGTARWLHGWGPYRSPPKVDFSGQAELVAALGPALRAPDALLVVEPEFLYFPVMSALDLEVLHARRDRMLAFPYFRTSDLRFPSLEAFCAQPGLDRRFSGKTVYFGLRKGAAPPEACGQFERVFETARPVMTDEAYAVYLRR